MPNGVHAPVHMVKAPLPQSPVQFFFRAPKREELPSRHHPVLPLRQLRDPGIPYASLLFPGVDTG